MKKKALWITLGSIGGLILIALITLIVYTKGVYGNRWFPGTKINGIDVSGLSLEESKNTILKDSGSYSLTIVGRDNGNMVVNGSDIQYTLSLGDHLDPYFKESHTSILPHPNQSYDVSYDVTYDEDALTKILNDSPLVKGSSDYPIVKPESAYVQFSDINQCFQIENEVNGNTLKKKVFTEAVKNSLAKALPTIDLTRQDSFPDVYKAPKLTSDSEILKEQLNKYNNHALRFVTWNLGNGVKEELTPKKIAKWIVEDSSGNLSIDMEKVEKYVETFCLKYKTVGATRTMITHNKKKLKVAGGDYGWQLNYEQTVKEAKNALKAKIKQSDIDAYVKEPSNKNRKPLSTKYKASYLNEAFQMNTDDKTQDYDTNNYVEVALNEQMVYVMKNGKVKFSCHCISGRPVEGRKTTTGAYFIKEHQPYRVLKGDDYETPVTEWVRITWTGTGFHAAPWQSWGSWSPSYYLTRGSHGCVNLSSSDAKTIYNLTSYREIVFLHY